MKRDESSRNVVPHLLVKGYRGFNVLTCDSRYFALASDEGAFDMEKVERREYGRCFEGRTADEVMARVDAAASLDPVPRLIESDYWGFDIVECGPAIYALGQGQGPFDPKKVENKEYARCFAGKSVEDVRRRVDAYAPQDLTPRLRKTGYWGYNIIECAGKAYALGQDEGVFDRDKAERGEYKRCVAGDSAEAVKKRIDEAALATAQPIVRETGFLGYNIIEYGTRFFGLARSEGAFDFGKFQRNEYRRCQVAPSIREVKEEIEAILIRTSPPRLIEAGYRRFNIIECGPRYYALAQDEGAFDLGKFERQEYRRCFSAKSLDEVKRLAAQAPDIRRGAVSIALSGLSSLIRGKGPASDSPGREDALPGTPEKADGR